MIRITSKFSSRKLKTETGNVNGFVLAIIVIIHEKAIEKTNKPIRPFSIPNLNINGNISD